MYKPTSIAIEETKNSIIDIINKSKLHPSIIELMLKGIYLETVILSNDVFQQEKETYLKEIIKENNYQLKESTEE